MRKVAEMQGKDKSVQKDESEQDKDGTRDAFKASASRHSKDKTEEEKANKYQIVNVKDLKGHDIVDETDRDIEEREV